MIGGLRVVPKIQITKEAKRSSTLPSCLKNTISCSIVIILFHSFAIVLFESVFEKLCFQMIGKI